MEQKCDKLYPSASLENNDLETRIEKRLSDVNSLKNSNKNIKEMNTYFKVINNKPKNNYDKYKIIPTILKSIDTFVNNATTSSSLTLSLTGIGLIAIPISTATACGLSIVNKVVHEVIINKYNKYEKQNGRDEQTTEAFDKLNRKSLQDNLFDKNEYESPCNIFTKYVDEKRNESF